MNDKVKKPKHYQLGRPCYEVRDVIRDRCEALSLEEQNGGELMYDYSNAIKYLLRWFGKDGLQDLQKAKYCIEQLIEMIEANDTLARTTATSNKSMGVSITIPPDADSRCQSTS